MRALSACIIFFFAFASVRAEVYTMYTGPSATGPSVGSSVSLSFDFGGVVSVPSGNFAGSLAMPATGFLPVDMNLDGSNSGTLWMPGGSLTLGSGGGTQSSSFFFSYSLSLSLNDLRFAVQSGPVSVNNGSFSITSLTPGSFSINQGTMNYFLNSPSVGIFGVTGVADFAVTPLTFSFSSLGTQTIAGTADDDLGGVDTVRSDSHTLGGAGLTGLSAIDTDGSEMQLSFSGLSIPSTITSGTLVIPITISLAGSISVGVPEAGSVVLVGMASVGLLGLAQGRRK